MAGDELEITGTEDGAERGKPCRPAADTGREGEAETNIRPVGSVLVAAVAEAAMEEAVDAAAILSADCEPNNKNDQVAPR